MASFVPRAEYTPEELEKLYPPNLALKHVQIFLRHGERTPTSDRFKNLGLPAYWPYCNAARQLTSAILKSDDDQVSPLDTTARTTLTWKRRLETLGPKDTQITAQGADDQTEGICITGELTDLGRKTTLALGQRLRRLYVNQLGLMPDRMSDASSIYMRSTHMPRALESLQQVFTGFYPAPLRDPSFQATIVTRKWQDDQLYPNNGGCKRFNMLYEAFSKRAETVWDESPEMNYINSKIQKYMPEKRPVTVGGHPALVGIMDTNNSRLAHGSGVALPKEFDDEKLRANIDKISVDEWFRGYFQNREYRTVGIGGLVGDVLENISKYIEDKNGKEWRFALNGCHDTTLAGFMSSFGIFQNERWPPFTSHIAIETFRSKDTPATSAGGGLFSRLFSTTPAPIPRTPFDELSAKQKDTLEGWYVRIRYNDRAYTIPGCKAPGKHLAGDESFCTLAAFKEIADKFVPKDWKAACKSNLDKGVLEEEDIDGGY